MEPSIVWREIPMLVAFEDSEPIATIYENSHDSILKLVKMNKQEKRDLLQAVNVEK